MNRRVTIIIEGDLDKQLRLLQAQAIRKTSSSVSFSKMLNDTLRKGLK